MSAWLTVYCTRPVDHVTAADLTSEVEAADVHTDAEVWGIEDEAAVDEAMSHLAIERAEVDGVRFHLRYAGSGRHPVLIRVWDGSSAEEMLGELRDAQGAGASRVRTALRHTVAVVGLSVEAEHQGDMGIVLASRVAEAFASEGRGLIRDQNDEWWAVVDGVPSLVLGRGDA